MKTKEETLRDNIGEAVYKISIEYGEPSNQAECIEECTSLAKIYATQQSIAFAEFAASSFWFNEGISDLWESFDEGQEFEVNGKMQFRFTTAELYSIFLKSTK